MRARRWLITAVAMAVCLPRAAAEEHRLRVDSAPAGARLKITTADGKVRTGRSPWNLRLPPGKVQLEASSRRHRTRSETVELTRDTELVTCLDPVDQLVSCQRIIPCGMRPKSVVLSPDGSVVWVAILWGPITLQVFDTRSGRKLEELSLKKHGATELELTADGSRVYVSQMATGEVHEFDFKTRKLLRTFNTRGSWTKVIKLSADEKSLFASNWVSSDISVVDLESGTLRRRIKSVRKPRGMYPTPDGRYLYVAGFKLGELQKIDLSIGRGKIIYSGGVSMRHIVPDEEQGLLYISDMGRNQILTLDLKTDKLKRFARTNNKPNTIALSTDCKILFVSNRGARGPVKYTEIGPEWGSVLLYDTATGEVLDVIVGGNQPTALAVSRDGGTLVFSDFLDNRLRVYRVPPYAAFKQGKGGRARSHRADLAKKNWSPGDR